MRVKVKPSKEVMLSMPQQLTAYIGDCPACKRDDSLMFIMRDMGGEYLHCMYCNLDIMAPKGGNA